MADRCRPKASLPPRSPSALLLFVAGIAFSWAAVTVAAQEKRGPVRKTGVHWGECIREEGAPLVLALMITGKDEQHEPFARRAMDAFWAQTYPSKALVIVNDSPTYRLGSGPCQLEDVVSPGALKLGALRNRALAHIPFGTTWVQWDDDDWRGPTSLEGQLAHMRASGADAVILKTQYRYFLAHNSSLVYNPRKGIMGTIMVALNERTAAAKYPDNQALSEDAVFIRQLRRSNATLIVWQNKPEAYFRLYHGRNSWSITHFDFKRIPGNDTWCIQDDGTAACEDRSAEELHHKVLRLYSPLLVDSVR